MSANEYLISAQSRHAVFLLRRGAGLANEIIPLVERLIEQVVARVANTPDQSARQQVMLQELQSIMTAAYAEIGEVATQGLIELAEYEGDFQARLYNTVATVQFAAPVIEQLAAIIDNDPLDIEPGRQITIRQALREYSDKKQRQITRTITDGIATQRTNAEISRDVQALASLHKRQADALVRTVANGTADASKRRFAEENAEFLQGERWTATLDGRTSPVCQARDGEVYPVNSGPRPPAHYNCRSLRVAVVRQDLQLPGFEGERPAVGDDGPSTVSARTTYSGFLRQQSVEFQNEVLGVEKAKLFRAGKVTLKDMVNDLGEPLTIEQIRAREGLVF